MGVAAVDVRYTSVLKDFLLDEPDHEGYFRELKAYTELEWATPKLLVHNEYWLEVERLTPILDLGPDRSRKYAQPLRELLQAVHEAGWWHRDTALTNVVVHPARGPLLIDWEWLTEASGSVSYDLYSHAAAGVDPAWSDWSASWWTGGKYAPGKYWA